MNKYNLVLTSILAASSLVSGQSWAGAEDCNEQESNYLQCDSQLGWYVGGELGSAKTKVNKSDVDRFFRQSNIDASAISVDDSDMGWSAFAGYQFNTYLALEVGYLDLGERSVDLNGRSTDTAAFFDNVEHIYPQSAKGLKANVVGSYPLTEDIKVSGKVGFFDWRGKYRTYENTALRGSDKVSDTDFWYGLELNYRLNNNWQAYGSFSRVKLTRDKNNLFSLGLRYYFGQDQANQSKPVKAKPAPVAKAPLAPAQPVVVKAKDSDADGVIDKLDQCPNTELGVKVDANGCTVMAKQQFEFSLVVRYANDSAKIADEYQQKITELAEFIKKYNVDTLTIFGHTSAPGPKAYNQKLSERRAKSVAKMLVDEHQINPQVLKTVGKGETELVNSATTEQADAENRRIELYINQVLTLPVKKQQ